MSLEVIVEELERALYIMNHSNFSGDSSAIYDSAGAVGRALRVAQELRKNLQWYIELGNEANGDEYSEHVGELAREVVFGKKEMQVK